MVPGKVSLAEISGESLYLGQPSQLMIQPYVSVEVLHETSPGVYESYGPSSDVEVFEIGEYSIPLTSPHNNLLLDTGANSILIVDAAAQDLVDAGYQIEEYPYNEVGVSVGLAPGGGLIPGAFSALDSLRSWRFHAHILQLPVTTEVAVHGGLDYFNFPKSLADIRFTQPEGGYRCEVRGSEDGRLAYTFNTRRMRHETPRAPKRMIFNSYPIMDGAVMHAVMEVELHQYASTMLRRPFSFTTGDHPLASLLRRLKPGRLLYFIHAPRCAAVIHAPVAV